MIKKILTVIILFTGLAMAQSANAQFRYGVSAGPTLTNLDFKHDLVTVKRTVAGQGGVMGEMIFPGVGIGLDLGLLYSLNGAKVNIGEREIWASQGYKNTRLMIHQLTIPFHLKLKWRRLNGFEERIAPIVYGGPDFNISVAHSSCKAFQFSGGDISVSVGAGAELFTKWQVTAGYTWGMTYTCKTRLLDNYSAKNRGWNLRVAYFFDRR